MATTAPILATKDANAVDDLDSNFDGWNGSDQHLPVGRVNSGFATDPNGFDGVFRSFVYFPISFSGVNTIENAKLYVMQRNGGHCDPTNGGSLSIQVRRMVRDWGEAPNVGEASWLDSNNNDWTYANRAVQTTGGVNNWVTEGGVTKNFTQSDNAWVEIDITDIVTAWWNHSRGNRNDAPNYGLILINANEVTRGDGVDFYSRQNGNSARIPYVTMTYNSNNAPSAPSTSSLNPRSDAVVNSLTPTFTGNANDPDAGDYITATQIIVYADDGTTVKWDSGQRSQSGTSSSFSVPYAIVPGINPGGAANLTGNTFYKWKVRTWDKGGAASPYSALQRFKVNTAPLSPTLVLVDTPANDIRTLTPTFQITHNDNDPGDTKMYGYQLVVEMSTGAAITGGDSGQVDTSGAPVSTKSVTVGTLTPPSSGNPWGNSYRARVRTKDINGAWGPYSGYLNFSTHITGAPINLSPANDEVTTSATPTLSGSRATTADTITSYEIYLFEDNNATPAWQSGTLSTGIVNGATFSKVYSGSSLVQGDYYQWQARVTSAIGGTSAWSNKVRFRVPSDATVPTQTAPLGTGVDDQPAFTGQRTSTFNRYQIEVYPSTSTSSNLGTAVYTSGTQSATIAGTNPTTFSLAAGTIPALNWATSYKWRVRVSADAGSTWSGWSGLASFTTDSAGVPTLTSPSSDQWITDSTPDMTITRAGTDTIDKIQVRVFAANGTTLLHGPSTDSDFTTNVTDVANATTGTWTYDGPTLTGGYYWWQARYQKTTGPWGDWSSIQRFRLNYAPSVPTELSPLPNEVVIETLLPTFEAKFNDNDITEMGDEPTEWEIVVEELDGTPVDTVNDTTGLVVGVNSYTWTLSEATLAYGTDYRWKTRFKDSKGVWGNYSGYQGFTLAVRPHSTGMTPTTSYSAIQTVKPTFSFTYAAQGGSAQRGFKVRVYEVVDDDATVNEKIDGTANEVLVLRAEVNKVTTSWVDEDTYQFESTSFFQTGKVYEVELFVQNLDGLYDDTPQTVRWYINTDAPDPVTGLSPTAHAEHSLIELEWDAAPDPPKAGHTFVSYNLYKKLPNDIEWQYLGSTYGLTENTFKDWYAGHSIQYLYRVTIVTTKSADIELESADDSSGGNIAEAYLDADVWMFIGADRAETHIQELPVHDEGHERVVQQEAFEVLGSDRKVIVRGFVLGHEGQITMTYQNMMVESPDDPDNEINETIMGRRLLDYLTSNKGPHILKSPFGDVWDAEFQGPSYKWLQGGHLEVSVSWIETGNTSMVSV